MMSSTNCRNCSKNKAAFDQELEHLALSAQQEIIRLKAVLQTTEEELKVQKQRAETAQKRAETAETKLQSYETLLLGQTGASAAALCPMGASSGRKFEPPNAGSGKIAAVQPFIAGQPDKVLTNDDMQLDEEVAASTEAGGGEQQPILHRRRTVVKYLTSEIFADKYPYLPPDWTEYWHESGVPIYKHLPSGVYTLARPFSADTFPRTTLDCVPITAVPCFYWRVVQNWAKNAAKSEETTGDIPPPDKPGYRTSDFLTMDQLRIYAEGSYEFSSEPFTLPLKVNHPAAGLIPYEKFVQMRSEEKMKHQVMFAAKPAASGAGGRKRPINVEVPGSRQIVQLDGDLLLEPEAILDEFSVKAKLPLKIDTDRNYANDFLPTKLTVRLGNVAYASARGTDAKQAAYDACARTVEQLVPGYKAPEKVFGPFALPSAPEHLGIFDSLAIDDAQVSNLTENLLASNPVMKKFSPLTLFAEFLRRYPERFGDDSLRHEFREFGPNQFNTKAEYWLRLNEVEVLVPCFTYQQGKAVAAQKMLCKFHPNLKTWGELARTYIPPIPEATLGTSGRGATESAAGGSSLASSGVKPPPPPSHWSVGERETDRDRQRNSYAAGDSAASLYPSSSRNAPLPSTMMTTSRGSSSGGGGTMNRTSGIPSLFDVQAGNLAPFGGERERSPPPLGRSSRDRGGGGTSKDLGLRDRGGERSRDTDPSRRDKEMNRR